MAVVLLLKDQDHVAQAYSTFKRWYSHASYTSFMQCRLHYAVRDRDLSEIMEHLMLHADAAFVAAFARERWVGLVWSVEGREGYYRFGQDGTGRDGSCCWN